MTAGLVPSAKNLALVGNSAHSRTGAGNNRPRRRRSRLTDTGRLGKIRPAVQRQGRWLSHGRLCIERHSACRSIFRVPDFSIGLF
jgi:hypothetical protein